MPQREEEALLLYSSPYQYPVPSSLLFYASFFHLLHYRLLAVINCATTMVKPAGDGVPLLYTSIVLLVVTWLTFTTRIAVRIWRKNYGGDDLLMGIGQVCPAHPFPNPRPYCTNMSQLLFTVTSCLCIVCSFLGSGQLAASIPPNEMMKGVKVRNRSSSIER